jgi:copper(I)-binding protein
VIRSRNDGKLLRRLMIGAVALAVPVLAGCEAGNNTPVLEFHPAANGAYGSAGPVSIIDSFVLGGPDAKPLPKGGSASFFLGMFNSGHSPDKLVSVSAPGVAGSVQITGGSVALPAQQPVYLTGPEPKIVLKKLTTALASGQTITVDLTFQNAGTVSLPVPVQQRTNFYTGYSPPASAGPTPTATVKRPKPPTGTASPGASPAASATPSPPT